MTTHSTIAVDALVRQMESAFAGPDWHSVLRNLGSCTADDWDWTPPGGRRTIRDIVRHIAVCKLMWQDQLFGDRRMDWDDAETIADRPVAGEPDEVIDWLNETHAALRDSVALLVDDALATPRDGYWDRPRELGWSITIMIEHDLYHAGEINLIRALHQGNDG